jgi:molybdenum storage protein
VRKEAPTHHRDRGRHAVAARVLHRTGTRLADRDHRGDRSSTSLQNAHLMQMLLAKHGGILTSIEEFEKLPLYLRAGCIPVMVGMLPFHHWERPPETGRISANRTDAGVYLMAEFLGARSMIFVKDENGLYTDDPKKNPEANFIGRVAARELLDMDPNDLVMERVVLE